MELFLLLKIQFTRVGMGAGKPVLIGGGGCSIVTSE